MAIAQNGCVIVIDHIPQVVEVPEPVEISQPTLSDRASTVESLPDQTVLAIPQ